MIKIRVLAFLTIILLLPILGCKIFSTERMPPATVLSGIPGATAQPPGIATALIATPIQAEEPNVISIWFNQDKDFKSKVYFAFVIENPNVNLVLTNLEYQVVAYDASETILGTYSSVDIGVLFPGERRAISGPYWIDVPESSTVTRISVQITRSADVQISEQHGSPFTTEKVAYFSTPFSRITGVIQNNLNADISYLGVTAIAYDESGNIIGAGYDEIGSITGRGGWGLGRLPANGYIPAIIGIHIVGEPAKVELYPFLINTDAIEEPSQTIEALRITTVGASQSCWGMVVENTDTKTRYNSGYTLIAYDENGVVLDITEIVVSMIFPGERLGVSGFFDLPQQTKLGKVEAHTDSGSVDESDIWGFQKAGITGNPLIAEGASYPSENYGGLITGIIKNSYGKDLQYIWVTAIAYDASGAIIGGWSTNVSSVPANGQIAISIWSNLQSSPAVIELYPTLSLNSLLP